MLASPKLALAQEEDLIADPVAPIAKLDATFGLPDACVVIALRPAQVFRAPAAAMLPSEVIQAVMMQQTGLDPLAAEQLLLTVTPPTAGPPAFSLHGKFSAPFTLKTDNLPLPVNEEELNGKRYLHAQGDPTGPSFYFPDDTSLVAANEVALKTITGAERPAPGALLAKFIAADHGDDLLAMIDLEPLRPLINMGLMQAPLPPELAEFASIPNLVKTIELRINFSHAAVSELIVSANSEADADRLVGLYDKARALATLSIAEQTMQMRASDDPVEQANVRYIERMTNFWNEQTNLSREGDRLVIFRTDATSDGRNQVAQMAVIGVLVGLLLPAIQAAREAARRATSTNNLKQIMLSMLNYESTRATMPPHASYSADGKPLLSWRVHMLPFLEQNSLYQQFHLDEPWDSEHNKALIPLMPDVFLDPSSGHKPADGLTNYLGVAGAGRVFDGTAEGRRLRDITDGLSNTLAIVQVNDDHAVTWTQPEDWQMDAAAPLAGLGGMHNGTFLAAFCDGSVRLISTTVDPTVLKSLSTVAGDEPINGGY